MRTPNDMHQTHMHQHRETGPDDVWRGALSPERMRAVLQRLAGGFYDRADVRREVARRIGQEFFEAPASP